MTSGRPGSSTPCTHCDRMAKAKGLCMMHYTRKRRGQDMDAPLNVHQAANARSTIRPTYSSSTTSRHLELVKDKRPKLPPHHLDVEKPPTWSTTIPPHHHFAVAVCADPRRFVTASTLADLTQAEALVWDSTPTQRGCEANHRRTLQWLASSTATWAVVLEDDVVIPTTDFRSQLLQALNAAPTPLVSLYLGRGRPPHYQLPIMDAITTIPSEDTCWLIGEPLLSCVAYAIHTDLIPDLINCTDDGPKPIDEQISTWARATGTKVAYCWPSLVDHRDGTPLVEERHDGQPRGDQPRVAWKTGTRDTWTRESIALKTPEELGITVIDTTRLPPMPDRHDPMSKEYVREK